MKFKIGDRVKVINCKIGGRECKNFGKIFTIKSTDKNGNRFPYELYGTPEFFGDNELELVNKFTKSDLKDGDIVTYRNGDKRTVIAKKLINSGGYIAKKLDDYTDELKDTISGINLDIVKIERPIKYETLFERKEEILDETEKRYLLGIIRPFKDKVRFISKDRDSDYDKEFIFIDLKNEFIYLPNFKINTMYKGMKEHKKYTLKELGI